MCSMACRIVHAITTCLVGMAKPAHHLAERVVEVENVDQPLVGVHQRGRQPRGHCRLTATTLRVMTSMMVWLYLRT